MSPTHQAKVYYELMKGPLIVYVMTSDRNEGFIVRRSPEIRGK
jgi:hypothetical protein